MERREACRDHNAQGARAAYPGMRYYTSVPDWEEFQERETDEDPGDPSFLHEEPTTDTDLLTGGGANGD